MFENFIKLFKKNKKEALAASSKDTAKERLHLVLMQDRANVSADFLDLMKEEIIEVIKKYIDIDEKSIDVRLTNQENDDGTQGAPALYANIPIVNIKDEARKLKKEADKKIEDNKKEKIEENKKIEEEAKKIVEETKEAIKEENTSEKNKKDEKEKQIKEENNIEKREIKERKEETKQEKQKNANSNKNLKVSKDE